MFQVGKNYEFRMIEDGGEVYFHGVIEKYEHPLIQLAASQPVTFRIMGENESIISESTDNTSYPGRIINVTSPNFISALEKS